MYVLGIETSCDETAASVVENGKDVLSNVVSSSLRFHAKYGGIIPEIASRMQLETITQVTQSAIRESGISLRNIGLVSVTSSPGLIGSLLVGISFANSLALSLGIPLVELNHLHSHIYANFLGNSKARLPVIALVVSGGHTSLFYVKSFKEIEPLGETQDDACGEAFDKVAKILGLGYPGGPIIEKLAKKGNAKKIKFACSGTKNPLDFSFSGIKTAVLYYVQRHKNEMDPKLRADICASFQEAVVSVLLQKAFLACSIKRIKSIVVGGGVAANHCLRQRLSEEAKIKGISAYFPPLSFCLDNAAMVAGLGYKRR
ncbi:MAG: tRNA (adenosine(37)-N6)-threonylcarbamoyltransferase complex transferase subunit TsaD [Candidatus Omnitrophota bacterium]